MKQLSLSAILLQATLGNLCMMQMAHAEDMPHDMHEKGMDMMTSAAESDCVHCSKEETPMEKPADTMDCAGGYCLMNALTGEPLKRNGPGPAVTVIASSGLPASFNVFNTPPLPRATAPPGSILTTRTIVLRC